MPEPEIHAMESIINSDRRSELTFEERQEEKDIQKRIDMLHNKINEGENEE